MVAADILVMSMLVVIIILIGTACICLFRVFFGPTIADRVVGLNTVATKSTIILVLLAIVYQREMLLDVAIASVMLNITGSLAIAKHLEGGFND
ncbi:MAG: cation:proton antiporter [Theionarchaea archaeon]|nr:cation:proton antiporter [Theionarchaea archaeon]